MEISLTDNKPVLLGLDQPEPESILDREGPALQMELPPEQEVPPIFTGGRQQRHLLHAYVDEADVPAPVGMSLDEFLALPKVGEKPDPGAGMSPEEFLALPKVDLAAIADQKMNLQDFSELKRSEFDAWRKREKQKTFGQKSGEVFRGVQTGSGTMIANIIKTGIGAADVAGLNDKLVDTFSAIGADDAALAVDSLTQEVRQDPNVKLGGAEFMASTMEGLGKYWNGQADFGLGLKDFAGVQIAKLTNSAEAVEDLRFEKVKAELLRKQQTTAQPGETYVGAASTTFEQVFGDPTNAELVELQRGLDELVNPVIAEGMAIAPDILVGVGLGKLIASVPRAATTSTLGAKAAVQMGASSASIGRKVDSVLRNTAKSVRDKTVRLRDGAPAVNGAKAVAPLGERLGGFAKSTADLGATVGGVASGNFPLALAGRAIGPVAGFTVKTGTNVGLWGLKHGYRATRGTAGLVRNTLSPFAQVAKSKLEYGVGAANRVTYARIAADKTQPAWTRAVAGQAEYISRSKSARIIGAGTGAGLIEAMQEGLTESAMLTSTPSRVGEGIGGAGVIGGGVGLAGGALATRSIDDHFADLDALHYRESMVERGDDPTLFDDLPQSARRDLAAMQGVLGDTADIRLASGAEFAKATNQAPGEAGQQGVFLTDAGEVIINMDTIGSDPNTLLSTVSHEIGHAAYKSLPDGVKDQWRDIAHYQFGDAVVEQFRTDYSESLGQEVTTDVALDEMFAEYFLGVNSSGRKLLKGKVALGTLDAGANRAIRRITDAVRRKMGIEGADIDPNTQLFEFTPYKANPEVERFVQDSLKELGSPLPKVPMPDPATTVDPDDPGISALQQALDAEAGEVITLPNGKAVYPVRAEGDKVSYVDADEATNRIQESEETPDSDDVRIREGLANAREGKGPFTDLVQEAPVGAFADPADPVEAGQLAAAQAAAANENLGPNTRAQAQTDVDRITQDKAVTPPPPAAYTPVDPLTAAEAFKETIDRNIELGGLEMVPFQYEGDAGIQERELLPFGVTVNKEGDPSIRGYDAAAVRADLQENGAPEGFDSIRDFRETSTLAATNPGAITPEKRSALFKAVRPHTRNFLFDKVRGIGVESAGKSSTTGVSSNNINEPTRTRPRAFSSTRGQTRKTSVDPGDIVSSYERARSTQEDSDPFLDDGSAEFDPASSAARARQLQDLKRETPKATPEILRRAKAAKTSGLGGFEHDVHAEKGADRVVKVWKHALGDGEMPIQYIKRHQVFNRDFDMGSRIEGYDRNGGIISSSPFFDAENADLPHPTPADVDIYMRQKGYRQTAPDEYRKGSTTVTDVKPENFIQTSEGPQLIDALVETDDITSQVKEDSFYQNESDPFGDDPFGDDPFANDFGDDNLFSPNRGTTNDPTQANDPAGALRLAQGDSTQAGGLRDTGGVRRGEDRVQAPYSPYVQTPKEPPLAGLPATVEVDGRLVTFGPLEAARQAAIDYTTAAGIPYTPIRTYAKVNRERATRIANAFDQMEHNPSDPAVQESYQAMADETLAQYEAVKASGLVIEPMPPGAPDPYGNPRNAVLDVVENNHMWFYPTSEGFGGPASADVNISGNPLMDYTGEVINGHPMQVNDVFRVVHDYFGHVKEGLGFRAGGEENAWRSHSAMYSDKARPAMTTETRGQNSWVNYGPFAEANRTANGADTEYAPQKVGLLPEEFVTDGAGDSFSPNRGSTNDTNDITGRTEDVGQLGVGDGGVLPAAGDLGTGARPTPSPPRPGTPEFLAGKPIAGRAPALIEADIDAAEEIYERVGPDSAITTGITGVRDPLRAVHWSKAKAPTNLDPKVAGGAPGAEGKRQKNNPALFEPRTYFGDNDYAQNPEALVTSRAKSRVDFEIDRDKLFEPGDAPEVVAAAKEIAARIEGPQAPAETYIESAIKAAGYEGVYDPATRAGYLFNEVGLENASVSQDLAPGVRAEGGILFSPERQATFAETYADDGALFSTVRNQGIADATLARAEDPDNFEDFKASYLAKEGTTTESGGIILNTDEWRDLFPEYNGANAPDVHHASSYLNKAMTRQALQDQQGVGNNGVLLMAGGGGSGKGTVLKDILTDQAIVIDGVLGDPVKTQAKIDQAKAAGFTPTLAYVHTPPAKAFRNAVARAQRSGRVVPADVLLKDNLNAREAFKQTLLANPDLQATVFDNSGGFGEHRIVPPDQHIQFLEETSVPDSELPSLLTEALNEIKIARPLIGDDIADGLTPTPEAPSSVAAALTQAAVAKPTSTARNLTPRPADLRTLSPAERLTILNLASAEGETLQAKVDSAFDYLESLPDENATDIEQIFIAAEFASGKEQPNLGTAFNYVRNAIKPKARPQYGTLDPSTGSARSTVPSSTASNFSDTIQYQDFLFEPKKGPSLGQGFLDMIDRGFRKRTVDESGKVEVAYDGLAREALDTNLSTSERLEHAVNGAKDNLVWLYDKMGSQMGASVVARAKQWYVGARRIAEEMGAKYGITPEQASGVLAVFSPQKDWFQNVDLAERSLGIINSMTDTTPIADSSIDSMNGIVNASSGSQNAKDKTLRTLDSMRGKTWGDLTDFQKAWAVRMTDETVTGLDRTYPIVSPEGGRDTRSTESIAWGSVNTIQKALAIYENASPENIALHIGDGHKVRSFYNNIVNPASLDFTTMDTHAVNAALISMLGGSDLEVSQNFGGNVSKWTKEGVNLAPLGIGEKGVKGTYPMWGEAYKRAAAEVAARDGVEVKPREMQSVTWEAIRAMISPEQKRDNNLRATVEGLKARYYNNEIDASTLRESIFTAVNGFDPIPWNQ